jgi:hypothetical protein
MKTSTAIVVGAVALLVAPAFADKSPASIAKKPNCGESFDLAPRRAVTPIGDETAPAKPKTLTDNQVAQVVKGKLADIQYCWSRLPAAQRIADTTAILRMEVEAGAVADVEVTGKLPADAASCIAAAAERWVFPVVEVGSVVEYPVALRAL